ncbi:hypothetical protein [Oceanobacillus oncorhynchi]|uniref:hypothetical protein n=1 Tax=Oceanobacillus oncorhynchi TaxID=545501 RepID=UPI0034D3F397
MKLHTARSLFDAWDEKQRQMNKQIKQLKEKQKQSNSEDEQYMYQYELEELFVKVNLINQFLADVGLMAYVEENK